MLNIRRRIELIAQNTRLNYLSCSQPAQANRLDGPRLNGVRTAFSTEFSRISSSCEHMRIAARCHAR